VKVLKNRWDALPVSAKSILPPFLILGAIVGLNVAFDLIRNFYLSRELPKREQILRTFLTEPRNYKEQLGGPLESLTLRPSVSDTFATYTFFDGLGTIRGKEIPFRARVLRNRVEVYRTN
jgi:hypothetical protein